MGYRIVCVASNDTETTKSRLRQLAHYLRGLETCEISVFAEHEPLDISDLALSNTHSVTFAGRDSQDTVVIDEADAVVSWSLWPERELDGFPGLVARLDESSRSADHALLIRLHSDLSRQRRRDAAVALQKIRAVREEHANAPVCIALDRAAAEDSGIYDLLICSDESAQNAELSNTTVLVVCPRPERYIAKPDATPEPIDEIAALTNATLVVPGWSYRSFVREHPDLEPRVIPLDEDATVATGERLQARFAVAGFDSAETGVSLPLAEYLSDTIVVAVGTPGSDRSDGWGEALRSIEGRGSTVTVVGNPEELALARREVGITPRIAAAPDPAPQHVVVSVNPDWIDDFGHHGHYDTAVAAAVAASGGHQLSLTSMAQTRPGPQQVPTFSRATYGFAPFAGDVFVETFRSELNGALKRILSEYPGIPVRVYMYSAGIDHLVAIILIAAELADERVSFQVNLLRAHDLIVDMTRQHTDPAIAALLTSALDVGPTVNVRTFAETSEFASIVEEQTGHRLPHWPAIVTSDLGSPEPHKPSVPLVLTYPGTQQIKGLDTFVEFAEAVAATPDLELILSARGVGHTPDIGERLAAAGVQLTDGVLTPPEYAAFMRQADIVALPYRTRPFGTRASGAFSDAVQLARPVVATKSTWAGRLVADNNLGATFEEGDVKGFVAAARVVAADYETYRINMESFASDWLRQNNPAALLEAMRAVPQAAVGPGEPARIDALETLWMTKRWCNTATRAQIHAVEEKLLSTDVAALAESERSGERLRNRDLEIERLAERITQTRADRDATLADLRETHSAEIADRDSQITNLQQRIDELRSWADTEIERLQTRIETREDTIGRLKDAVADSETRSETTRDRYEVRIQTLKNGVVRRDDKLASMNQRLEVRLGNMLRRIVRRRR